MLDSMIKEKIKECQYGSSFISHDVLWIHKQDDPIVEDVTFDEVAKILLKNYDKIKHHHKVDKKG